MGVGTHTMWAVVHCARVTVGQAHVQVHTIIKILPTIIFAYRKLPKATNSSLQPFPYVVCSTEKQ